jgi:hypothetical protein
VDKLVQEKLTVSKNSTVIQIYWKLINILIAMSGIDGCPDDVMISSSNQSFKIRPESGIVPRAIEKLFDEMDHEIAKEKNISFGVYCSFIEIYNEKIYDILSSDDPRIQNYTSSHNGNNINHGTNGNNTKKQKNKIGLKANPPHIVHHCGWNHAKPLKEASSLSIRQKLDGTVFVDGLTLRNISSKEEMLQAFREVGQICISLNKLLVREA